MFPTAELGELTKPRLQDPPPSQRRGRSQDQPKRSLDRPSPQRHSVARRAFIFVDGRVVEFVPSEHILIIVVGPLPLLRLHDIPLPLLPEPGHESTQLSLLRGAHVLYADCLRWNLNAEGNVDVASIVLYCIEILRLPPTGQRSPSEAREYCRSLAARRYNTDEGHVWMK